MPSSQIIFKSAKCLTRKQSKISRKTPLVTKFFVLLFIANNRCKNLITIIFVSFMIASKSKLKREFNTLLENKKPIVLILASCWSYQSELSKILRSYGLYSAISVAEERSNITVGKVFYLDKQQCNEKTWAHEVLVLFQPCCLNVPLKK